MRRRICCLGVVLIQERFAALRGSLVVGVVGVLAQHLVLNRDARDDEDVVLGLLGRRVRASSVTWLSAVRVVGQKGACANDDRFVSILVFILGENCDKNKGLLAP